MTLSRQSIHQYWNGTDIAQNLNPNDFPMVEGPLPPVMQDCEEGDALSHE
jgi:hypothetical protein